MAMSRVQIGLEALVNDYPEKINGARIGVVCHPASVDSELNHALNRLTEAGAKLAAIFGPEHGARGEAQDMEGVDDLALDPQTSGGLLISLPENQAHRLLDDIKAHTPDAAIIGCIKAKGEHAIEVV